MNPIHVSVVNTQARIFAERLKVGQVLRRAGLQPSTWWRWTQGAEPKISSLEKVDAAIDAILEERSA